MNFSGKKFVLSMALVCNLGIVYLGYLSLEHGMADAHAPSNEVMANMIDAESDSKKEIKAQYKFNKKLTYGDYPSDWSNFSHYYANGSYNDYYINNMEEPETIDFGTINDDAMCLGMNIYHEARGESIEGQKLVAMVTLNRVKAKRWKDTVCGVVYEKYQFEWTQLRPYMDLSTHKERQSFFTALKIAQDAINGNIVDESNGADHYFNPKTVKVQPTWPEKMTLVRVEGDHKFYKDL